MANYSFDDQKHRDVLNTALSVSNTTSTIYPLGMTSNSATSTSSMNRVTNISFRSGNSVYASTGFFVDSSRGKKTNIHKSDIDAVDLINEVDIVNFNYKIEPDIPKIGFIAEDTNPLLSTPQEKNMDLTNCIGILLKAVQELDNKITNLERRLQN